MITSFKKGFTLVEMAVSIGIFSIISAIVIFNHGKFNSSIVVTNLSYEVALAVRQAQVYGLAVKQREGISASVEYAYGVYFEQGSQTFYIFADKDNNQQFDPTSDPCDDSGSNECQERIEVRGDVVIDRLETSGNDDADYLTILFLRPNPVAIIRDNENSDDDSVGRQNAVITLRSDRAEKEKQVVIELSGQISVRDVE